MLSRPAAVLARASRLVLVLGLAACAGPEALPEDPTGRLFARSLDEISDLYIAVSYTHLTLPTTPYV